MGMIPLFKLTYMYSENIKHDVMRVYVLHYYNKENLYLEGHNLEGHKI